MYQYTMPEPSKTKSNKYEVTYTKGEWRSSGPDDYVFYITVKNIDSSTHDFYVSAVVVMDSGESIANCGGAPVDHPGADYQEEDWQIGDVKVKIEPKKEQTIYLGFVLPQGEIRNVGYEINVI